MKKMNIFDLMIENATDWKWVEREIEELADAGYDTLNKIFKQYSEIFINNNVPISKFEKFVTNFYKTYNEEVA